MGFLKTTVKILSYICYVGIIIYLLVSLPIIFGYKPLVVLSGSMEPTCKVGSIIYYEENKSIEKEDVIVFTTDDNTFVTHRVIDIIDGKYVTKGDANESADADKVLLQSVKGKVINIEIPYAGYYVQYVNTNFWLIAVVVIILISEFLISNLKAFDIDKGKEAKEV